MKARLRDLRRIADKFGREVEMTRGGHYRLVDPIGSLPPIVTPATPSCHRSVKRLLSDLRRAAR